MPNCNTMCGASITGPRTLAENVAETLEGTDLEVKSLSIGDGDASSPSLTFTEDPDTGLFRRTGGQTAFASNGVDVFSVRPLQVVSAVPIRASDGSTTAPTYSFESASQAGMYNTGGGVVGMTSTGVTTLEVHNDGVETNDQLRVVSGSAALPGYSFVPDPDTGFRRVSANTLAIVTNGVDRLTVGTGAVTLGLVARAPDGASTAPAYSFADAIGAGMFHVGGGVVGLTSGADTRVVVHPDKIVANEVLHIADGTAGGPSLAFESDTDTGLYLGDTDTVAVASAGVDVFRVSPNEMTMFANLSYRRYVRDPWTTDFAWLSSFSFTVLRINFTVASLTLTMPTDVPNGRRAMVVTGSDANNDTATIEDDSGGDIITGGTRSASSPLAANTLFSLIFIDGNWYMQ